MAAEIRETVALVEHDHSFNSFCHNAERYRVQFPDSEIASKFCVQRTKLTYLLTEALDPFFKEQFKKVSSYSLSWDEVIYFYNIMLVLIKFTIVYCTYLNIPFRLMDY